MRATWIMLAATLPVARAAFAQTDTLRLGQLHQQAIGSDPRQTEIGLLGRQNELRLRSLSAERLPSVRAEAQAQHQSDVFAAPAGSGLASPSRESYDTRLEIEQSLWDPTRGARRDVERARLAQAEAEVRTALHGLRQEVNDAFFSVAVLNESGRLVAATIAELEEQLADARERVGAGTALPGDTAAIQAAILERRQDQARISTARGAALSRLSTLTGRAVTGNELFMLPDLTESVARARREVGSLRNRPEHAQFDRSRDLLARRQGAVAAEQRPRLSAFGRTGLGRPGLNPLNNELDSYHVLGLQMKWTPWTWGTNARERQALELDRQIVAAEEAGFTSRLGRAVQGDIADMERLDTALALDDRIVPLRESVEEETRLRFREGVVTASAFTDRSTDALEARLARATHRVELVQAHARFLTTLGLEIR